MSGKKKMIIKVVSPKMAKYLKDHPYMEADGLQKEDKCKNPKGFTQKQRCKNLKTRSKKGERKNSVRKHCVWKTGCTRNNVRANTRRKKRQRRKNTA